MISRTLYQRVGQMILTGTGAKDGPRSVTIDGKPKAEQPMEWHGSPNLKVVGK